ncbi:hypothetical protein SUGI_0428300 [Cryptomeria japonica]|nr:hypothetical protein SUGI_0428300 [Cryptomeria japonica]
MMSEIANIPTRGSFMAAIFALQGLGILAGSIVEILVSICFIKEYANSSRLDQVTAAAGLGVEDNPGVGSDSCGLNILLENENTRDSTPKYGLFSRDFVKYHGLELLATASSWFFVDLAFYNSSLFQKDIYRIIGGLIPCHQVKPLHEVFYSARAQAVIIMIGTLSGYVYTIFLIDHFGRRKIQFVGFFFMSVFFFALAIPCDQWFNKRYGGFLVTYSLTFFFANFGPNTTTFIVPAKLFPTRLRSTCHGISVAAGKAGTIIGMFAFLAKEDQNKYDCT